MKKYINLNQQNQFFKNFLDTSKKNNQISSRINKLTKVPFRDPLDNSIISLQTDLYRKGFFDKNITEIKAIDGIQGKLTNAAINRAKQSGYDIINGKLQKTNLNAIIQHKKTQNLKSNRWAYIDKNKNNITIYDKDRPIYQSEVSLGANVGDYATGSGWKYYSQLKNERQTGAGIFPVRLVSPTSAYGEPIIRLKMNNGENTSQAIHAPAGAARAAVFNNGNKNDNRVSYGCISLPKGELKNIYNKKLLNKDDTVYISPEIQGNYIYEDNGILKTHFSKTDGLQKYQQINK